MCIRDRTYTEGVIYQIPTVQIDDVCQPERNGPKVSRMVGRDDDVQLTVVGVGKMVLEARVRIGESGRVST